MFYITFFVIGILMNTKHMTASGPSFSPIHEGNAAAMQAAYAKRPNVTAVLPPRGETAGSALARSELAALAAKHAKEHKR